MAVHRKKLVAALILMTALCLTFFSTASGSAPINNYHTAQQGFPDVTPGNWFYTHVVGLAAAGVIGGYPDGAFKPNRSISRAEFAAIIARAKGLRQQNSTFSDMRGSWANGYIGAAVNAGIVRGYPNGTFRPNSRITRTEITAMLVRAYDLSDDARIERTRTLTNADFNKLVSDPDRYRGYSVQMSGVVVGIREVGSRIVVELRVNPDRSGRRIAFDPFSEPSEHDYEFDYDIGHYIKIDGSVVGRTRDNVATARVREYSGIHPAFPITFKDVPEEYWQPYWGLYYISVAKISGVVEGYADGSFRPNGNATRAETAAMMNRVLAKHLTQPTTTTTQPLTTTTTTANPTTTTQPPAITMTTQPAITETLPTLPLDETVTVGEIEDLR